MSSRSEHDFLGISSLSLGWGKTQATSLAYIVSTFTYKDVFKEYVLFNLAILFVFFLNLFF